MYHNYQRFVSINLKKDSRNSVGIQRSSIAAEENPFKTRNDLKIFRIPIVRNSIHYFVLNEKLLREFTQVDF